MNRPVIEVKGLARHFGSMRALDGLDLEVSTGSVTGLLGPNGAGKTTLIHILIGLLKRHEGTVSVLGFDPDQNDVDIRRRTGFVPEDPKGEPRYTVRQNLKFMKAFRPDWDDAMETELLARFDLDPDKSIPSLSRGERAKMALTGALAYRPELLVLDDPTSGLDPLARREFIEGILGSIQDTGRTVFFSTHHVDDIERVADRIIMIHSGRRLLSASLEDLHMRWRRFSLSFKETPAPSSLKLPGLRHWEPDGRSGVAVFDGFSKESESRLRSLEAGIESLPLTLEDIYIEMVRQGTGKESR